MKIAIGGLHTECSSYSPLEQERRDFRRLSGKALLDAVTFDFAERGIEATPLFQDRSVPGGPVSRACFDAQSRELLGAIEAAGPLDGLLLLMHGAMFVPGIDDPEGWLLSQARGIVGADCVITAAFDLHGQITDRIVGALDGFAAYRTAPHVDVPQTYARAAKLLADALTGGPRPMVRWTPVPMLVPGEMSSTFVEPCRGLYAALPEMDARSGVADANLMIGYVWADSPRATAAAVVTCFDPEAGQAAADEIAATYLAVRDALAFDMTALPLSTSLLSTMDGPVVLADSGDNPTAGGVGDRADVLSVLRDADLPALLAGIAAPEASRAALDGADVVTVGGELGGGGPKVTLGIQSARPVPDGVLVETGKLGVVLCDRRRPYHHFHDFEALGIDLADHPTLVVKSGYLSPDIRTLPRRQIMLLTDGAVSQDLTSLENRHRPRPTWPFQKI